jgi:hypothetical protein
VSTYVGNPRRSSSGDQDTSFFYRRRQEARAAEAKAGELSVEAIASVDNLAAAFDQMRRENGQAPGPDGLKYPDLGRRELFEVLRPVSKAVLAGTYRPAPGRQVQIPKGGGRGYRTLTLRNLVDRVVAKALNEALMPYWETCFLDGSHGFRPGRSHLTLLAALERAMVEQDRWVLVSDDVQKAFDSVRIDLVLEDHHRDSWSNRLLQTFIEALLRGGDPARKVGIDQGSPYMPCALNVHLHHRYDAHAHTLGANPGTPTPWYRYADNLVVPCRDVQEGERVLLGMNQALAAAGLALKGENGGRPVDLRRGGQVHLLGFVLFHQGDRLRFKLGQDAWDALGKSLLKAHAAERPSAAAQAVLEGWVAAHGPAFHRRQDRLVDRLLQLAARCGFREVFSRELYLAECASAWLRWGALVRESGQKHSPCQGG